MLWKVGGNFETVAITCETNWKECVIAVANYLWCEVVSDVVDYLAKEGIIWVLTIAIISTMLIRIKYCKNTHTENIVLNKRIRNKVGYKIQDLELKINVLTYKMQYGTWPSPHQICSWNPKRLRKVRMTLSNPGDRKYWIKHALLNPSLESNMCASYSNTHCSSAVKLMNRFDIKQERTLQHVKSRELSTEYSSIETLKSTSDQSVNTYSRTPDTHPQNVNMKENDLSKREDVTLQQQNVQLLLLNPDVINRQSSRMILPLTQNGACTTNVKYNPCQKFTDTICKCKSFLKELQCNGKCLHHSSETNKTSLKTAAKQIALFTTEEKEASCDVLAAAKGEEINEMRCVERIKDNTINGTEKMCQMYQTNISNDAVVLKIYNDAPSKEFVPVFPIMRPKHNVQSSQETLYEVRRRLQSLHNVLQTYQDTSQSSERDESTDRIGEIDSFITVGLKIGEAGENKASTDYNVNTKENLRQTQCPVVDSCEYFELDRSEESLSSLAEYSSNTSKMYQYSNENVTLRNTYSKEFSRHNVQRSVRTSNLSALVTTEPYLCSCSATLRPSEDSENEYKESAYKQNISDCSCKHESESYLEVNKDAMKTDALFNIRDNISEAVSERICYISSPEYKNIQTQNGTSSMKRFATEKFSNILNKEQYQENMIIAQNSSQNKISNNSNNRKEKSTALLLQEALHFKNALLTQSRKKYLKNNVKSDIADESPPVSNNNFPSMIVDIKAEEAVFNGSCNEINQRCICLEMKQRRDLFPQSLKKVNTFAHREDERDTENQDRIPETSSEYFSITDFAIRNNELENILLKSPISEKVISITIPVNVKSQDEINMNDRLMQTETVLQNIQTHVNLRENLRETITSDIDNNTADKHSPTMLKLEDLILERVKNIRDYIDTFLQSQNTAIFKVRKALQFQGKSDTLRHSDEANHVAVYNQLTAPSSCTDQIVGSSKNSSDFLTNTWPNYMEMEYKQETDDVLKYSSDMNLKRNPGIFALISPIEKNKFSNKNDTRQSEVVTELKKEEANLSLPITLTYSSKNYSKSTHKITDLITPRCKEYVISNTENDKIDKDIIVDVNTDLHKCRKQTQITESKSSAISYFPLGVTRADAKVFHMAHEEYMTKSNCNSISSNSYFTDKEIISDVKMDNISSKSTSNIEHLYAKSNVQKKIKQNVIKQTSINKCVDANIAMPCKLPPDIKYSNLTIFIDSDLILDKLEYDYSTNAETVSPLTVLKEHNIIFDTGAPLLSSSLDKEDETLSTDGTSSNNFKQNDEMSVHNVYLSPRIERYSKPFQTYSQIKAKSNISLITSKRKDLNINLYPQKSHSFLTCHDTTGYIGGTLHQSYAKLYNDKNKCIKNKLRLLAQSKSIISPRRISTKSCIPILKNRLESSHQIKHQAQMKSPTRSPLIMLWGEKTFRKDYATDKEVARRSNVSINKYLCAEKAVLNLTKLNTEKNILTKELEKSNMACEASNIKPKKNSRILSSNQNKSFAIDKKHLNKRNIYSSKSDTNIMQHIEKIAPKEVAVISIMTNDSLQKKYPAYLFILNTKNVCPVTDLLTHKNKLWAVTVEKTEKEITAKPSITDTCTSVSGLQ